MNTSKYIAMSAADILAAQRAKGALRSKAFYERHKTRILADRREGYRLVRAQSLADLPPPAELVHNGAPPDEVEHDHYSADEPGAPKKDPKKVVKKVVKTMQGFVDRGEYEDSTTTTQHKTIMLLMDHLPDLNLSEDVMNEYRRYSKAREEIDRKANLARKATEAFNIITFRAYVKKIDAAHGADSLQSLLVHVYQEVPVRDDFHAMRLVANIKDASDKNENYLVMNRKDASIVINAYNRRQRFKKGAPPPAVPAKRGPGRPKKRLSRPPVRG